MDQPSALAVAADPDWLPHTFDESGAGLTSVHVPRADRARLTFLSDDHYQGSFAKVQHPAAALRDAITEAPAAPLHFIWHTSFCCSTLLAKALEIPGLTHGLREPDVLINLANRFIRGEDAANRERLELVLRLLERPYDGEQAVIVKPTNFANRLIGPVLALRPASRAILLYSDLRTLLLSLAKKNMRGRIWGRRLYASCAAWTRLRTGFSPSDTFLQTDLQIAGLAWLMQIDHFNRLAGEWGPGRVMTMDSATFMAAVPDTLAGASRFFGLDVVAEQLAQIAAGPVFTIHSKFAQQDYSVEARDAEHAALTAAHGEEIAMVEKWVDAVAAHCGVPLHPGRGIASLDRIAG
jgi:hypothetical protein